MLIAVVQAVSIRLKKHEVEWDQLSPSVMETHRAVSGVFSYLDEDRPLDNTLRTIVDLIQNEEWELYS